MINSTIAIAIVFVIAVIIIKKIIEAILINFKVHKKNFFTRLFNKQLSFYYRSAFIFAFAFLTSVGIWSYRNYIVFDQFIPSKSNMWLEVYLANVKDFDGRLSYSTVMLYHPVNDHEIRDDISKIGGEIEWLGIIEDESRLYLKKNRKDYYNKVLNRLINAFIFTIDDMDFEESDFLNDLNYNDKKLLKDLKLIAYDNWVCLHLSEKEFLSILNRYDFEDSPGIYNDWLLVSKTYTNKKRHPLFVLRGFIFAFFPSFILIFFLFKRKYRKNSTFLAIFNFYLIYLIPYIFISHQLRYQRPLMVIQIILIAMFLDYLYVKLDLKLFNSKIKNLLRFS